MTVRRVARYVNRPGCESAPPAIRPHLSPFASLLTHQPFARWQRVGGGAGNPWPVSPSLGYQKCRLAKAWPGLASSVSALTELPQKRFPATDERLLLGATPVLELALACHGRGLCGVALRVGQHHRTPGAGICRAAAVIVAADAHFEIIRVADIVRAVGASQDVDVVADVQQRCPSTRCACSGHHSPRPVSASTIRKT